MYSEDDDFGLYASSRSKKLASLFKKSNVTGSGNLSLMYKAPKQPRNQLQQNQDEHTIMVSTKSSCGLVHQSSDSSLSLILLKVVQTFKLENNEYKSQGKLGAAILGNCYINHYQLILYKEKTRVVAQAVLTSQFWFAVQPNNYTTFYDKHKTLWSIYFEGTASAIEFTTQVAVARWCCSDKSDNLVQDLVVEEGGGKSVEDGSLVDISYTATLLILPNKLDKNIETVDNMTVTVVSGAEGKSKSWETMLIGMTEGSKRCIILPALQSERWKKHIQDGINSNVLLMVHVNQIKSKSDMTALDSLTSTELSTKARPEFVKDDVKSSRASLISRMAKMGQPTLPFKCVAKVSTASDSEETEEDGVSATSSDGMSKSHNTNSNKTQSVFHSVVPSTSVPVSGLNQIMDSTDARINMPGRLSTFGGNLIPPSTTSSSTSFIDPQLSIFLSELRTHNSELRMNINRVTDKIDKLIDKVDNLDSSDKVLEHLQSLEQKIISQFNLMYRQSCEITNVINKGTSNDVSSSSPSEKVYPLEALKKENADLLLALSKSVDKNNELQAKLAEVESMKIDLQNRLACEKDNRKVLEKEHSFLMKKLKLSIEGSQDKVKNFNLSLNRICDKVPNLEKKIEEKCKIIPVNNDNDVKNIMQTVFEHVLKQFTNDSKLYPALEIHSALAESIKLNTLEYLQSKIENSKNKSQMESVLLVQTDLNEQSCTITDSANDSKPAFIYQGDRKTNEIAIKNQTNFGVKCKDSLNVGEKLNSNLESKLEESVDFDFSTSNANDIKKGKLTAKIEDKLKEETISQELECQKVEKEMISNEDVAEKCLDRSPCGSVTIDTVDENWPSQPPPLSFDDEDKNADDDWLKM